MMVRRLEGSMVAVEFGRAFETTSKTGETLLKFEGEGNFHLMRDAQGGIFGVECESKRYVEFLNAVNASKEAIAAFRAALDDSKKAQRERMRR